MVTPPKHRREAPITDLDEWRNRHLRPLSQDETRELEASILRHPSSASREAPTDSHLTPEEIDEINRAPEVIKVIAARKVEQLSHDGVWTSRGFLETVRKLIADYTNHGREIIHLIDATDETTDTRDLFDEPDGQ